ncbi:MAG: hypothetical protein QOJ11_1945 [Frankiales bacterium]|jgi:hypothetical protein|nr:hypothetical protein [Frankiales bacterium]
MFEHLDDPTGGTPASLGAVQKRGRAIVQHRRRTRLATGSAALAATAGVTAVATVGIPGGQAGAKGISAGTASPSLATSALPTSASPTPTTAAPVATSAPSAGSSQDPTRSVDKQGKPGPAPAIPAACAAVGDSLGHGVAPTGYELWKGSTSGHQDWERAGAHPASLGLDVFCGPLDKSQTTPGGDGKRTLVKVTVNGHPAWLWHEYSDSLAGVLWAVGDTAWVQVEAAGVVTASADRGSPELAAARMSDADLLAFARALPGS